MSDDNRRTGDPLILTMHGNIEKLLANQENIKEDVKQSSKEMERFSSKTEDILKSHTKRIGKVEGAITGIKWVGSTLCVIFTGIVGYLGAKK